MTYAAFIISVVMVLLYIGYIQFYTKSTKRINQLVLIELIVLNRNNFESIVNEIGFMLHDEKLFNKDIIENKQSQMKCLYESHLNNYDLLCYFVLNNQVDKKWFKENYLKSVFDCVENELFEGKSNIYQNIMAVYKKYKKWDNNE